MAMVCLSLFSNSQVNEITSDLANAFEEEEEDSEEES